MPIEAESPPTEMGNRGTICVGRKNDVFSVLPGNVDESLRVMSARKKAGSVEWKTVWRGDGFDGEPCIDVGRLEFSDTLSIFTRRVEVAEDGMTRRSVVVLDFDLAAEDQGGDRVELLPTSIPNLI
jgi:hypothetical protein